MIIRSISLVAATALALSAGEAAAPQPLSFDCDAMPGDVTVMNGDHLPPATAITGTFRAIQARRDSNLRAVATVKLASAKDFVALQMTPTKANGDIFTIFVRNGDAKEEERTPLGEIALNQNMPFRIVLNGKQVEVAAAGQSISIRQSFRGTPSIDVSCTTGHFRFDTIEMQ